MSRKILKDNLQYIMWLIEGREIEFQLSPKFEWEKFDFDKHTLDLFERSPYFRLKSPLNNTK